MGNVIISLKIQVMKVSISNLSIISGLLISSITLTSCNQEPAPFPLPNSIPSLDQYLNDSQQFFTVDGNLGGKITGTKGTVLVFPPEAFFNPISEQIVSGDVNIQLVEIYSKSDMIKNNQSTSTGYKPFSSLGQISVRAFQDGQELVANKYFHIYYPYSGTDKYNVQPWIGNSLFWYGGSGNCEILPGHHSLPTNSAKCILPTVVNPNGVNSYRASMNYLGWVGCGTWEMESSNDAAYSTFLIDTTLNINQTKSLTRLFIIFHDYNSVIKFDYYPSPFNTGPSQFNSTEEIPYQSNISILVLHSNSQRFYMGTESISSIPSDTTFYIPMQETSLAEIKSTIENFD